MVPFFFMMTSDATFLNSKCCHSIYYSYRIHTVSNIAALSEH